MDKLTLIALIFFTLPNVTIAQGVSSPFKVEIFIEIVQDSSSTILEEDIDDLDTEYALDYSSGQVKVNVSTTLEDTLDVSALIVEFGTIDFEEDETGLEQEVQTPLFLDTILYDIPANYYTYKRVRETILLGLGYHNDIGAYCYAKARVINTEEEVSSSTITYIGY